MDKLRPKTKGSKSAIYVPVVSALWKTFISTTPRAAQIYSYLSDELDLNIVNDSIAFRTISNLNRKHPDVGVQQLGSLFEKLGFTEIGDYVFKKKHLTAKCYDMAQDDLAPKIFISQLELHQMSSFVRKTLSNQMKDIPEKLNRSLDILTFGSPASFINQAPDYQTYQKLLKESEYAAWFYIHGFVPVHFAISVNHLWKKSDDQQKNLTLTELNNLLESKGWALNKVNGRAIQGTSEGLLEQSSTLAEPKSVKFSDGISVPIPSSYLGFAHRHVDPQTQKVYSGFVAKNADKLFESTHVNRSS